MTDFTDKLDVVTVIFNPWRYRSRYALYRNFARDCAAAGVRLWTVEIAFGERPFEVTDAGNPRHIQLRTSDELWLKENALNLAFQRLPLDAKYVAWVDADVKFARHDWASETVHRLQHYAVVQMFSEAIDLCPDHRPLNLHKGFAALYHSENFDIHAAAYEATVGPTWHPGFAWAARRQTLDDLGGLFDVGILGAGDRHFATALVGQVDSTHHHYTPLQSYISLLNDYQTRAEKYVRRNLGMVPGLINHYWHGSKINRFYTDRWKILVNNRFCPHQHLKRNTQGLLIFDHQAPVRLRDEIRFYFSVRNEDSIHFEEAERKL
jgi:hypothetical protein